MRVVALSVLAVAFWAASARAQVAGGFSDASVTDKRVIAAADAAIKAQRLKDKGKIDLAAILKAEQQVVAGMNYRLKLSLAVEGGTRDAEVLVWAKLDRTYQLTSWRWLGQVKPEKK